MERFSARRRHCCSRPVRGVRGRFVWRIRKHELTRRSVQWGKISVHVSGRDRESRSREVSARLRVREKLVARMRSRECCHVKHVGTRHSWHSDHMYFHHFNKLLHCSLPYCVHCFLRQCIRVLTMAPPTPPTSFVSQGLRGQRLFGWPFGGVVVLAFSRILDFWGRAVERPRSNRKCSPGWTFSGRNLEKRPPQGLKSSPEGYDAESARESEHITRSVKNEIH